MVIFGMLNNKLPSSTNKALSTFVRKNKNKKNVIHSVKLYKL